MTESLTFGILSFTSLFTLINPLGTMPVFMAMTANLSLPARNTTAKKASIISFITIVAFAFTGQLLFQFFGISANSFRVVGGVIFFMMGMDMLRARLDQVKIKDEEVKNYVTDISITPLAIPMICGPGAITNIIVLMEDADSVSKKAVLIGVVALIMMLTYVILFSSSKLFKVLGQTGINVMMRIMGLIVMVIAVEFFFSGIGPMLQKIFRGN